MSRDTGEVAATSGREQPCCEKAAQPSVSRDIPRGVWVSGVFCWSRGGRLVEAIGPGSAVSRRARQLWGVAGEFRPSWGLPLFAKADSFFIFLFKILFIYLRERAQAAEATEGDLSAGCAGSPMQGLDPRTLGS